MTFPKPFYYLACALFILIGAVGVASNYRTTAPCFDEPASVAAGLEWVDKGTYAIDSIHPPLPRILIGISLYLSGKRYPNFLPGDPRSRSYNDVGNIVLASDGRYFPNLIVARMAILPFFIIAALTVFIWTREVFGNSSATFAVGLFTALPAVLAYSGLDYTDLPAAAIQFVAIYAFAKWLAAPDSARTIWLGVSLGLALLSNFSSLLFVPAGALAILLCKWLLRGQQSPQVAYRRITGCIAIALFAMLVIWGGYRFSLGHVRESMRLSPESMPTFQHFPPMVGDIARKAVAEDYLIPAPALVRGLAIVYEQGNSAPPAYLLGHKKQGGWWYFFPVAIAVKTPLAFLLLSGVGAFGISRRFRAHSWQMLTPLACALGILVVTMPLRYDAGIRHVLVIFPLLAMIAGYGAACLLKAKTLNPRLALVALLVWQVYSGIRAHVDYLAYFNEMAGSDPSKVLLTGCDLDCGQDLVRLSESLHARHIEHFSLAVWSSADLSQLDLPEFSVMQPFQPASGWVAVSARSLMFGDVLHQTYPADAFAWLARYQPVERIGKTLSLYYIP